MTLIPLNLVQKGRGRLRTAMANWSHILAGRPQSTSKPTIKLKIEILILFYYKKK